MDDFDYLYKFYYKSIVYFSLYRIVCSFSHYFANKRKDRLSDGIKLPPLPCLTLLPNGIIRIF